jgi:hypothetical protein
MDGTGTVRRGFAVNPMQIKTDWKARSCPAGELGGMPNAWCTARGRKTKGMAKIGTGTRSCASAA